MSDKPTPPSVVSGDNMHTTITGTVHQTVLKLDPNMLAVLAMVVVLNGLFFWALRINADHRHTEFMTAIRSCVVNSPSGMDR